MSRPLPHRTEVRVVHGLIVTALLFTVTGSRPVWLDTPPAAASDQLPPAQTARSRLPVGPPAGLQVVVASPPMLAPGLAYPLDVEVVNTNRRPVLLSGVQVKVSVVNSPTATADRPCSMADFRTRPGHFRPVLVTAGGSVSLSAAGIPRGRWPQLAMINSRVNQDGCQGSRLTLDVRAEGTMA